MAVAFGEAGEIAFRVDDRLLDVTRALFEQAPQQVRLPEPELPCTRSRVASSSVRSRRAGLPPVSPRSMSQRIGRLYHDSPSRGGAACACPRLRAWTIGPEPGKRRAPPPNRPDFPMAACGLDFGTSNTTLGHRGATGPVLLPLEVDHVTVPSAIFFEPRRDPLIGPRRDGRLCRGQAGSADAGAEVGPRHAADRGGDAARAGAVAPAGRHRPLPRRGEGPGRGGRRHDVRRRRPRPAGAFRGRRRGGRPAGGGRSCAKSPGRSASGTSPSSTSPSPPPSTTSGR